MEEKISGKLKERPEWDRIMFAVRNKSVDGVIFVRMDRIARSVKNLLTIVEEGQKYGVKLISINEPFLCDIDTPQGKLILTMLGAIAEFEANLIRERTLEGKAYAKRFGTKSGKPMHRPEKNINWKRYDELKILGVTMKMIAKDLGVSRSKLYDAIKSRDDKNGRG